MNSPNSESSRGMGSAVIVKLDCAIVDRHVAISTLQPHSTRHLRTKKDASLPDGLEVLTNEIDGANLPVSCRGRFLHDAVELRIAILDDAFDP